MVVVASDGKRRWRIDLSPHKSLMRLESTSCGSVPRTVLGDMITTLVMAVEITLTTFHPSLKSKSPHDVSTIVTIGWLGVGIPLEVVRTMRVDKLIGSCIG